MLTGLLPGFLQRCACRGKHELENEIKDSQRTHLKDIGEYRCEGQDAAKLRKGCR